MAIKINGSTVISDAQAITSTSTISATGNVTAGNVTTAGSVTINNVTLAASGTNLAIGGNTVVTANPTGTSSTTGNVTISGNVTGGNIATGGTVSASGNITGNYILGNGSQLTGIDATSIQSGTSNVKVTSSGGNVTVSIGGTPNVTVTATTGQYVTGVVSANGNITGGNINTAGIVSTSGNIYGANLIVSSIETVTGTITGGNLATGGTASATGNITGGNILTGGLISSTGNITSGATVNTVNLSVSGNVLGTLLPAANVTYNLGSPTQRWNTLYLAGNTIDLGQQTISANASGVSMGTGNLTGANITTGGIVSATGTITGGNLATGGTASATGTITGGNLATGGTASATGTITGGNLATGGTASATGNITGGNVLTGGLVSATGNITGGNLATGGTASATGNITGGNLLTGGTISATGNITGANVNTAQVYASGALSITNGTGNINLTPAGNLVLNTNYINGLQLNPQQDGDAASKYYVDIMSSSGLAFHTGVTAATTTTLATTTGGTITYTQPNGVANGVGALLTTTGSFNLIDTANVQTVGTRILVKNEANAVYNGVYTWANATNIVRSTDTDEYGPDSTAALSLNDYFFVSSGSVNKGSAFVVSAPSGTITFGTSNIVFSQFSSAQTYTAGNGIAINTTVISALVDNATTAFDNAGNIIVKASATLTTPNIGAATGTSLSVTGTITGASHVGSVVSVTGTITGGNLATGGTASATGNITGGNVLTGGLVSATATITGGNLATGGTVSATGNITGGNISATAHTGTTVSVSGTITGGNLATGGTVSATGNITGNYILGNVSQASGFPATYGNSNVATYLAAFGSNTISTTGTITSGNITGGNVLTGGLVSATGNITGGNISATTHTGTTVSVTGTVTGGNLATGGTVSATGNVSGNYFLGNGSALTGVSVSSVGTLSSLSVTGTITVNSSNGATAIANGGTNGSGNIGASGATFNTVYAKATTAQYADLAEKYTADAAYAPGTVLVFGGTAEVTVNAADADTKVAGVVSTDPGFIMNEGLDSEFVASVALTGRVPTFVVGPVKKGDLMVAAGLGRARAEADPRVGSVIGKALEDFEGTEGTIEVVVGRF